MEGFNDEMQFCVFIPHMELTAGGRPSPAGIRRDGHLLFEVEMYFQKGCIMLSGVGSS